MKVVIIGGGIAGLTVGALLQRRKYEIVINERYRGIPTNGNAFLMHYDGVNIIHELKKIDRKIFLPMPGKVVNKFKLQRPSGKDVINMRIPPWQCLKRAEFINFLYSLVPYQYIKEDRDFSHFIYEDNRAIAAQFKNGDVEYGDIFIGADGGNSAVRKHLFGQTAYTPTEVKEIVGISVNKEIATQFAQTFTKTQSNVKGLAFGFIPSTDEELVWFLQFDPTIADIQNPTPSQLKEFCLTMMARFPQIVKDVINSDDFSNTYVWNTRDFDALPSFHKSNIVLIGDAAHLALPFTSAGTTNAIRDAKALAQELFNADQPLETVFTNYYNNRIEDIRNQVTKGRELKNNFLHPSSISDDDLQVPLVYHNNTANKSRNSPKEKIRLIYFSDPICSTCWTIQPQLRKMQLEYEHLLDIDYRMGGLLPSWDEYSSKTINKPIDAAYFWEEAADVYDVPMRGDVWIEDPLYSSYPPSIAFKAAQMQCPKTAMIFLRRIREMLFLEKKNIARWETITEAAFECGLDTARFQRDFEGKAVINFKKDLLLSKEMDVTSFPTIFFSYKEERIKLTGYHPYNKYEEVIRQLIPNMEKHKYNKNPLALFEIFMTMSTKEFAFFTESSTQDAINTLNDLYLNDHIEKYVSRNGPLWLSKLHY